MSKLESEKELVNSLFDLITSENNKLIISNDAVNTLLSILRKRCLRQINLLQQSFKDSNKSLTLNSQNTVKRCVREIIVKELQSALDYKYKIMNDPTSSPNKILFGCTSSWLDKNGLPIGVNIQKPSDFSNRSNQSVHSDNKLDSKFRELKLLVDDAISAHKTFTMCSSSNIRRLLLKRGWIEKFEINKTTPRIRQQANSMSNEQLLCQLDDPKNGVIYREVLLSKMLYDNPIDFIWDPRVYLYKTIQQITKPVWINHFRFRGVHDFCSKIGLYRYIRNINRNNCPHNKDVYHPRCYLPSDNEMNDFILDYRITACISLLKWSLHRIQSHQPFSDHLGVVPLETFFFALLQCIGFIKSKQELDFKLPNLTISWITFLDNYSRCVNDGEHFSYTNRACIKDLVIQTVTVLKAMRKFKPELIYDGVNNIWMLKPNCFNRGEGIHICKSISQLMDIVKNNGRCRYVIQKYIERPLLIYQTKFDIRQWFLISSSYPSLTIWMYNECYLRFSGQIYNIKTLHESVHLTNNSVQYRYKVNLKRNSKLPANNMWDLKQFQSYLRTELNQANVWNDLIYPGMKRAIVAVVLAAHSGIEKRANTFELYGADFLLTRDFKPWLLEINCNPAMSNTTSVTARLCPQVLDDLLKIIVDKHEHCTSNVVGHFELIYDDSGLEIFHGDKQSLIDLNLVPNDSFNSIDLSFLKTYSNIDQQSTSNSKKSRSIKNNKLQPLKLIPYDKIDEEQLIKLKTALKSDSKRTNYSGTFCETIIKDIDCIIDDVIKKTKRSSLN